MTKGQLVVFSALVLLLTAVVFPLALTKLSLLEALLIMLIAPAVGLFTGVVAWIAMTIDERKSDEP